MKKWQLIIGVVGIFLAGMVCGFLLLDYQWEKHETNIEVFHVRGDSMYPTLKAGDIIKTVAYHGQRLAHGDIVVFDHEGDDYLKRVIALEGERVEENNGDPIPENHVFVMGDNRQYSTDSRSFGPVPLSAIKFIAVK